MWQFRYLMVMFIWVISACGENILKDVASYDSDRYYLEEAQILVNKKNFQDAQKALDKLKHRNATAHLLQVAVYLGKSGFSLWDILLDLAEKLTNTSTNGSSGMEAVFNALSGTSSIFGTDEARVQRMAALGNSISYLVDYSQESSRLLNMRCILAGILLLPTSADTTTSVTTALDAMSNLELEVRNTGASCPNLSPLETAMTNLAQVQSNLALILTYSQGCQILDFMTQSGTLSQLEAIFNKLITNADKGCARIDCGDSAVCRALDIPCVQSSLDVSEAQAGDGVVHRCEIIQNCQNASDCF